MYALLLLLSAITTVAGLLAIGFGLAPYEGSLGNALVTAGSVGLVGGMILFGLAAAVRQLRRIADALGPRPASARRPSAAADGAEAMAAAPRQGAGVPAAAAAAGARAAYPPRAPADAREGRAEPRAAEPRAPAVPAEAPENAPVERQRPARAGEPPVVEEHEAVPLAPQRGLPTPAARGAAPRPEPEPRPTPADIMARLSNLAAAPPRAAPRPEPMRAPPALERPSAELRPRQNPNMFDALWPAEGRRQSQPEAVARAPRVEARAEPRVEPRAEPKVEMRTEPKPEPRLGPPAPRERIEPAPRERVEPAAAPPAAEMRPIAILKSGVIDGMAYTLYTDGSIEAELPQGTMRFGSIDELRTHLENAERQE
ncbi:MAG TPA: hypothetical protein VLX44_02575 [Xanthobacteraceae bacterium]|nr:hypothetical protein [Xanthobacteraceae bacterium]